jgi:starvation-inducible DNA-binding protein
VVSQVLRTNELQSWFISEHLVDMPLVHAVDNADESKIAS